VRISIDPTLPTPLFEQLASAVRSAIVDGRVIGGERLPAARNLAATLGINVHTVLRGYQVLRDEALIELHRGRGAVVVTRIGGRSALAGAIHDLVDEAKLHDLPEGDPGGARRASGRVDTVVLKVTTSIRPSPGSLRKNAKRMPRGIRSSLEPNGQARHSRNEGFRSRQTSEQARWYRGGARSSCRRPRMSIRPARSERVPAYP
jgi:GntR family transcriptional regulator